MPNPNDYDDRESFMAACVPTAIEEGRNQDQAIAMCSSMWENRNKEDDEDEEEDDDNVIEIVEGLEIGDDNVKV